MRLCHLALAVLLSSSAASVGPMTFAAALDRAAGDAPSLRGRDASVVAAQSSAIAADRLPDPTVDFALKLFTFARAVRPNGGERSRLTQMSEFRQNQCRNEVDGSPLSY